MYFEKETPKNSSSFLLINSKDNFLKKKLRTKSLKKKISFFLYNKKNFKFRGLSEKINNFNKRLAIIKKNKNCLDLKRKSKNSFSKSKKKFNFSIENNLKNNSTKNINFLKKKYFSSKIFTENDKFKKKIKILSKKKKLKKNFSLKMIKRKLSSKKLIKSKSNFLNSKKKKNLQKKDLKIKISSIIKDINKKPQKCNFIFKKKNFENSKNLFLNKISFKNKKTPTFKKNLELIFEKNLIRYISPKFYEKKIQNNYFN